MGLTRTIICKLEPTPGQAVEIDATLGVFARACDLAAEVGRRINSSNRFKVQPEVYREIRERFGLSANLAVRAIARACAALKINKRVTPTFSPTSADFDARTFAFHEKDGVFGVTLLGGRRKLAFAFGPYQRTFLRGRKPTSATLVKRRCGGYFLHVQVSHETPPEIEPEGVLGVDLGRRRVAVDSDGTIHEADQVNKLRSFYSKVRASVQRKGTKGAKRLLRRLSGRERRHTSHINHVISRQVVDKASETRRAIAIEDLTGIRNVRVRKSERGKHHRWSFYQLRQFIAYKAAAAGIPVVLVDPAYTSQTCHRCGSLGNRNALRFTCTTCGFVGDADINGALNISARGAGVTRPELGVFKPLRKPTA